MSGNVTGLFVINLQIKKIHTTRLLNLPAMAFLSLDSHFFFNTPLQVNHFIIKISYGSFQMLNVYVIKTLSYQTGNES